MSESRIFTYQTRPVLTPAEASVLDAYADLYGRVERSLFAALQAGASVNDLKRSFLPRFGITARQFNAIRVGLEGKIASMKARRPGLIAEATARVRRAEQVIAKLTLRAPGSAKLHQKKRRLATLKALLAAMTKDHDAGVVRLCFGSRRLFRAQFDLGANGYANHAEWRKDWEAARADQFFVIGSKDETAGNQSCQAVPDGDSLTLHLRLPNGLHHSEKHLAIRGVRFAYGQSEILAAVASSRRVETTTRHGKPTVKREGAAISYRFVRDARGWRVFASVEVPGVATTTRREAGAIGVDINADHLAVAETDRFGNPVRVERLPLVSYGKTADQAKAAIGDTVARLVKAAVAAGKPIAIEDLEFQKKKAELEAVDAKQSRLLSSFAYQRTCQTIRAACFRAGIEVIPVNPAYTSVIGAVNHAQRRGISTHQGAALAVARRGLGLSEAPTTRHGIAPCRNGGHVTFALPERNRAKHVWSHWSKIRTALKAAHAAHIRSGLAYSARPAPLRPPTPATSAIWASTAKLRGANRQQHCSADVLDPIPW